MDLEIPYDEGANTATYRATAHDSAFSAFEAGTTEWLAVEALARWDESGGECVPTSTGTGEAIGATRLHKTRILRITQVNDFRRDQQRAVGFCLRQCGRQQQRGRREGQYTGSSANHAAHDRARLQWQARAAHGLEPKRSVEQARRTRHEPSAHRLPGCIREDIR